MEMKFEDRTEKTYFQNLNVGDCFMFPNEKDYVFLRVKEYSRDFNTRVNAIGLHDFDHYNFLAGQEVIKVNTKLTIYK